MLQYMSCRDAAERWNISQRRVSVLCAENRIPNVAILGNMWIIPIDAEKPTDARKNNGAKSTEKAHPFVKWAGGKGQLLKEIEKYYPFDNGVIAKYAEPFVGGGAVLFDILSKYNLEEIYISDINAELINAYVIVRDHIEELIKLLKQL